MTTPIEETHCEKAAKTRVGTYLTKVETGFIFDCVDIEKLSLIVEVGTEADRFSVLAAKRTLQLSV
ncbi:MAG: hypothetical protein N3D85_06595 [Candidatus Bathyarchaeota archaeon]|nr:hypothetical protein [Candidatus Bathyarchaeota archaeon]